MSLTSTRGFRDVRKNMRNVGGLTNSSNDNKVHNENTSTKIVMTNVCEKISYSRYKNSEVLNSIFEEIYFFKFLNRCFEQ